jgi:hypothetical protein
MCQNSGVVFWETPPGMLAAAEGVVDSMTGRVAFNP